MLMITREFNALQLQAYEYIKTRILDGTFSYNQIYSESRVAAEIGISRTPVRDAVHRLCQESLIDIVPNKGFQLHRLNQQDILETYDIRSAIEGYCARKAALAHATPEIKILLNQLQNSLEIQKRIFEGNRDVVSFAGADQEFHRFLVVSSGNSAFINLFDLYMYRIKKLACYSLRKEKRMLETLGEHRRIFEAVASGNSKEAYEAVLFHMNAPHMVNLEIVYSSDQESICASDDTSRTFNPVLKQK